MRSVLISGGRVRNISAEPRMLQIARPGHDSSNAMHDTIKWSLVPWSPLAIVMHHIAAAMMMPHQVSAGRMLGLYGPPYGLLFACQSIPVGRHSSDQDWLSRNLLSHQK